MIKFIAGISILFGVVGVIIGIIAPWGLISMPQWLTSIPIIGIMSIGAASIILAVVGALILGGGVFTILSSLFLSEEERRESSSKVLSNMFEFFSDIFKN